MRLDLHRIATVAVDSFLHQPPEPERSRRRLPGVGGIAVGVVIGALGRTAYDRLRSLDLERVASAIEQRLKD
jgi:hypothetical protein